MGGVDLLDNMVNCYRVKYRSKKWWTVVGFLQLVTKCSSCTSMAITLQNERGVEIRASTKLHLRTCH